MSFGRMIEGLPFYDVAKLVCWPDLAKSLYQYRARGRSAVRVASGEMPWALLVAFCVKSKKGITPITKPWSHLLYPDHVGAARNTAAGLKHPLASSIYSF